ncbi:MAG: hypothetical protein N2234_08470 [Planctomycetota bacterium]|nr:hypothetical protein [Planctomycetota bacterium]
MKRLLIVLLLFSGVLLTAQEGKLDPELLEQKLKLLEQQLSERERKIAELEETIKRLEEAVASMRPEQGESPSEVVAEGRVSLYNASKKMVVVTIGSGHELKEGDILSLFREGKQIGELRVCRVLDSDMSNAEIVKVEGEPVVGDIVRLIRKQQPEVPSEKPFSVATLKDISDALHKISDALEKMNKRLEEDSALLKSLKEKIDSLVAPPKEASKTSSGHSETEVVKPSDRKPEKREPVDALVANVFSVMDEDRIVLNVGKKHGVKVQDIFVIYRDGEPIAKATVAGVIEDMAQAFVFDKKKDVKIQERDIAVRR